MKRLLALLTLSIFSIISQTGLIHSLDMRIMHNEAIKKMVVSERHDNVVCSNSSQAATKGCFQEITESKWISSPDLKIILITQTLFILVAFVMIATRTLLDNPESDYVKINGPPKNQYISLTGIIRNLN